MTLSIRAAIKADADLIMRFIRDLAKYEKLEHEVVADADQIRRTFFADAPRAFALIAERDGAPCGFAIYFFNYSTFLGKHGVYLEDLFVSPNDRGHGVGKALLARLARIAEQNDCGRLEWWVLDWNKPAIDFYRSIGAEAMDEWTTFRVSGDPLKILASGDEP